MGSGRPSGLHLSEIIGSIRQGFDEPLYPIDDAAKIRFIEGFVWEIALEYVHSGMPLDAALGLAFKRHMTACREGIAKQIKLEKAGIHMTPDGYDDAIGVMESYKMTRKNFKKARTQHGFEEHFWGWIVQEACYCWAQGVDTARWIVLFINGDYTPDEDGPEACGRDEAMKQGHFGRSKQ
jgi:hypothetical protein